MKTYKGGASSYSIISMKLIEQVAIKTSLHEHQNKTSNKNKKELKKNKEYGGGEQGVPNDLWLESTNITKYFVNKGVMQVNKGVMHWNKNT